MERRIFGIETEYGLTFTHHGQRRLSPDEVARYLFRRVVSWGRSSNVFLENGSRLYLDVGSHPEYATAECDDLLDLLAHDRAGERILQSLVQGAQERLTEDGIRGQVFLFKNNTDSSGNSYGCHENYLTDRTDDLSNYSEVLIPYLVSRQIWAGAGKIVMTGKGPLFCLSQRAEHIWESTSSATTRSRPIINTRDEPHADAERYRRLHVIVGDSNMSEYANYLKIGATAIMLQMLEDKAVILRDLTLENPIRAIREISQDLTCTRKVRLANGRELSALEIQQEYYERAVKLAARRPFTPQLMKALAMWGYCLERLAVDPLSLSRECDWVLKYHLIERLREKQQLELGDPKAQLIDLNYHDVDPARGLYFKLQQRGLTERLVTDQAVEKAMTKAPQTTRARLRGAFVKRAQERRRDFTVDWVHLKLNDQAQKTILMKDPFVSHDERVEQLIDSL
jgi:proteasome accessory factor A